MKNIIKLLLPAGIVIFLLSLFPGCSDLSSSSGSSDDANTGGSSPTITMPEFPKGLTGEAQTRGQTEDWLAEYDQFIILPELASNYQGQIEGIFEGFIPYALENFTWDSITHTYYTKKYQDGNSFIRINNDMSQVDCYYENESGNGENFYLKYKKTSTYTRGLVLFLSTGGSDHCDSVEIIETASKKFLKCARVHDVSTTPTLQHFVGITSKTSDGNMTTGRRMVEIKTSDVYTFTNAPGTTANTDYFSQDDSGWSGSSYELYGFFNDYDLYVETQSGTDHTLSDRLDEGYLDPDDLTGLFSEGLDNVLIAGYHNDPTTITNGVDFPVWDETLFQ